MSLCCNIDVGVDESTFGSFKNFIFMISVVLTPLRCYQYLDPIVVDRFHNSLAKSSFPPQAAASAYQSFQVSLVLVIFNIGTLAKAYSAMAKGRS